MNPSGGPTILPITAVSRDRFHVGIDRLLPAPATNVDVRWHVHVVREARLQGTQSIRCRRRPLRMRRRFDRVNVEMIRERMLRVQFQDRVQRRENLVRARDSVGLLVSIDSTDASPSLPPRRTHPTSGSLGYFCQTLRIASA